MSLDAAAVSEERAKMTSAAAAVDVDDHVVDPSNGDCTAVSYRPETTSAAAVTASESGAASSRGGSSSLF